MPVLEKKNSENSLKHIRLTNIFNKKFFEKGTHPGKPYQFAYNIKDGEIVNNKQAIIISPTYNKNGEILKGYSAVFTKMF